MAMAKKKQFGGPYLSCAVFCDRALREEDGAISAIRIIDRVKLSLSPETPADVPSEAARLLVSTTALIGWKTGSSAAKHRLKLETESPCGTRKTVKETSLRFPAEPQSGCTLIIDLAIAVSREGLHWVDVLLDDKRITRMPLLVEIVREAPPARPLGAAPSTGR